MVHIKAHVEKEIYVIEVEGEVDAGSSIHLDNALTEAINDKKKRLAVDLSRLQYISSAGLGVFISHVDEFDKSEVEVRLFGINETVQQVFEILGLDKLLKIVNTKEEAIADFQ